MKTIFKYPLRIADEQKVMLPLDYEILCVQVQHGVVCLWALVEDSNTAQEVVVIQIRGTGHDASGVGKYIGTVQMAGGGLVWHVFELSVRTL